MGRREDEGSHPPFRILWGCKGGNSNYGSRKIPLISGYRIRGRQMHGDRGI